jgi:primary-amine oxidase
MPLAIAIGLHPLDPLSPDEVRRAAATLRKEKAGLLRFNRERRNAVGGPVGYKLLPGENVSPFAQPGSPFARRAGFAYKHVWVTPYSPEERYAAGEYPNQHPGDDGLPAWVGQHRSIVDEDIVLSYTFGLHHLPRPEDWPVMPVHHIGFKLMPAGFFDENPALDVPPPEHAHTAHCAK